MLKTIFLSMVAKLHHILVLDRVIIKKKQILCEILKLSFKNYYNNLY